jgi:hypothetical protein
LQLIDEPIRTKLRIDKELPSQTESKTLQGVPKTTFAGNSPPKTLTPLPMRENARKLSELPRPVHFSRETVAPKRAWPKREIELPKACDARQDTVEPISKKSNTESELSTPIRL